MRLKQAVTTGSQEGWRRRPGSNAMGAILAMLLLALSSPAGASEPCEDSYECDSRGACAGSPGSCRPTSSAHCQKSSACITQGACTYRADTGTCVAGSDDDCGDSRWCLSYGLCTKVGDSCTAVDSSSCDQACTESGVCTFVASHKRDPYRRKGPMCIITKDTDCSASHQCTRNGRCHLKAGMCLPGTTSDCKKTRECKDHGRCSFVKGRCAAASRTDCAQSKGCRQGGQCSPIGGSCVLASSGDCAALCSTVGRCHFLEDPRLGKSCVVGSDQDCQRSTACPAAGLCGLHGDPTFHSKRLAKNKAIAKKCAKKRSEAKRKACLNSNTELLGAMLGGGAMHSMFGSVRGVRVSSKGPPRCGPTTEKHCSASKECTTAGKCQAFGAKCGKPKKARPDEFGTGGMGITTPVRRPIRKGGGGGLGGLQRKKSRGGGSLQPKKKPGVQRPSK